MKFAVAPEPGELDSTFRVPEIVLERNLLTSSFADGVGPGREIIERDPTFVDRAHELGPFVIPYTFKNESGALAVYFKDHGVAGLFTITRSRPSRHATISSWPAVPA